MNDFIIGILTKNGQVSCHGFIANSPELYPDNLESNVIDIELATKFLVEVTSDGCIYHRDLGTFSLLNEFKHSVLFLHSNHLTSWQKKITNIYPNPHCGSMVVFQDKEDEFYFLHASRNLCIKLADVPSKINHIVLAIAH